MFQQDFQIRQLTRFTERLYDIILKMDHGKKNEALELINDELNTFSGLNVETLSFLPSSFILNECHAGNIHLVELKYIADLIYQAIHIYPSSKGLIYQLIQIYLFLNLRNLPCVKEMKDCVLLLENEISEGVQIGLIEFFRAHDPVFLNQIKVPVHL